MTKSIIATALAYIVAGAALIIIGLSTPAAPPAPAAPSVGYQVGELAGAAAVTLAPRIKVSR